MAVDKHVLKLSKYMNQQGQAVTYTETQKAEPYYFQQIEDRHVRTLHWPYALTNFPDVGTHQPRRE